MARKPKPYTGVLAEPLELHAPFGLSEQNIAWIAREFRISIKQVKSYAQELFIRDMDEIMQRRCALFDHFGIDQTAPEAERTLALSLAARHEASILFRDERVDFDALCARFETADPPKLVQKLAIEHVPGFQRAALKEWQGRLTSSELVEVIFAVYPVMDHLQQQGKQVSDRRIAEVMLNEKQLPKILPPEAARSVQSILRRTGNKDRDSERDLKSRAEYLRKAISKARSAWAALKSGRADNFQIQIFLEVWPVLTHLATTGAGQDDVGLKGKK